MPPRPIERTIEERLSALEQQVAQLASAAGSSRVEAREFRLVDASGRVCGMLALTPRGPRLTLLDEAGAPRAELLVSKEGPGLTLSDPEEGTRVWLGATNDAARLALADGQGKQRAFLGVGRSGPRLDFYDGGQKSLWSVPCRDAPGEAGAGASAD